MSIQQLYDVLLAVKSDETSGKVYVYVKDQSARRTGTVTVDKGEILSIDFSQKTGEIALAELLSSNLANVIFIPGPTTTTNRKALDAPSILNVLSNLQSRLVAGGFSKVSDLRKEVEEILKKIYGSGIVNEIDRISSAYPPQQNPKGFLDQCKLKAMLMLSKDQVEKLFNPLYGRLK